VQPLPGIDIVTSGAADERTLAWMDDVFGGSWSSEALLGTNIVARCGSLPMGFATIEPKGLRFSWLAGTARESGVGIIGPIGVAPDARRRGLGSALLRTGLTALRRRGYRRALIPATPEGLISFYAGAAGARVAERFERSLLQREARRTLVLASGNGSNFQAVLDASRSGELPIEVVGLLCNNAGAYALGRARDAGMSSIAVVAWNRSEETRGAYDARLLEAAAAQSPDLVLLLGWMHLLAESFVRAFPEMLNLHPAFLPLDPNRDDVVMPDGSTISAFRGAWAVRDALAAGSPWVGATLHRVTPDTDRGPVLARKPLRVEPKEGEEHLMERVHRLERDVVRSGVMRWLYER
ncbi:MAG: GNAT family N-acetyltransferase, partial [Candidatus Eremiobacteraeota bacterium]|nr:GNAT family N-acetyltransferase [Candidatus Eremiobacteraeota bacterium]